MSMRVRIMLAGLTIPITVALANSATPQPTPPAPPDCSVECDPASPTYRCLPVVYKRADRLASFRALKDAFRKPQPFKISPAQLAAIFNMTDDPNVGRRGPTVVADGAVTNDGSSSVIHLEGSPGNEVQIAIPPKLLGKITVDGTSVTAVFENASMNSPLIRFSSAILDKQYGGRVLQLVTDNDRTVLTSARGCAELNLNAIPTLASLAPRLVAIEAKTGLTERHSAVRALSGLGEIHERVCKDDSAGGYGSICATCPVYRFNCGDGCYEVRDMGPGKHDQAKQQVELVEGKPCTDG